MFAEDDGGTTETPTDPVTSSEPVQPSAPIPGTQEPTDPEETKDYILDVSCVGNFVQVMKRGEKVDDIKAVRIIGTKTIETPDSVLFDDFKVDFKFSGNENAESYTFKKDVVNASVTYSISSIAAYSEDDLENNPVALENVQVNGLDENNSLTLEHELYDDSASTNDQISVTVKYPAVNTTYTLQLTNKDGSDPTLISVNGSSSDGKDILLTIDTSELSGVYNATIIAGDSAELVWSKNSIEYDHIKPTLTDIAVTNDNANDKNYVQITIDEDVPVEALEVTFNAVNRSLLMV